MDRFLCANGEDDTIALLIKDLITEQISKQLKLCSQSELNCDRDQVTHYQQEIHLALWVSKQKENVLKQVAIHTVNNLLLSMHLLRKNSCQMYHQKSLIAIYSVLEAVVQLSS